MALIEQNDLLNVSQLISFDSDFRNKNEIIIEIKCIAFSRSRLIFFITC